MRPFVLVRVRGLIGLQHRGICLLVMAHIGHGHGHEECGRDRWEEEVIEVWLLALIEAWLWHGEAWMHARHLLLRWQVLLEATEQIRLRYGHIERLLESRSHLRPL